MEVLENHGSSVARRGRKRVGERDLGGAVQAYQPFLVEGAEYIKDAHSKLRP